MKLIIDRFEGATVVCEDENKQVINVSKTDLPIESKEGDCLIFENGIYSIDSQSTAERKMRIREKMGKLFK